MRRGHGWIVRWVVALAAFGFVAWIIPVRDRCWDPLAPTSTRAPVSRTGAQCILHVRSGPVTLGSAECARLRCEPGLESTFARARLGVLVALLALYAAGTLAWAARWRALLGFAGVDLALGTVWRISVEAQAGGVLLPGGLGGDALRIGSVLALAPRPGAARSKAAIVVASVLLDRAIGLSVIAALAAALGYALRSRSVVVAAGPLEAVLAFIPAAVLGGFIGLRSDRFGEARRPAWLATTRLGPLLSPILTYIRDRRAPHAVAIAVLLSVVVAAVQFAVVRGLVFAVGGVPADETWVYVGTAMAFIVSAVPALPGGWGTADAAYVFFFGLAGLAPGVALAVCLMFRFFWYLSAVAGAILHMTHGSASAQPAEADPAETI